MHVHLAHTPPIHRLVLAQMAGHPYRLVSYLYIRDLPNPASVLRMLVDDPRDMIVDSGLFSLMFGSEQDTLPKTFEAYRDYTKRYLDDVEAWGMPFTLVEADTQKLLGLEATLRLRELFAPLGSRVIYVWHKEEGLDGLVKLAQERDYIAISVPELRSLSSKGGSVAGHGAQVNRMVGDLLRRVHEACPGRPPRIHLLGCTITDLMETSLAWSCDSTSWLSGLRFGNACLYVNGKLQTANVRSERFVRFRAKAAQAFPAAAEYAAAQKNPGYYLDALGCAYAFALYQAQLDTRYSPVPMRGDKLPGGPL